jgi:hypothetical protein
MKPIEKKVTEHIQNELHFKMRNEVENHVEIKMWTELMDFLFYILRDQVNDQLYVQTSINIRNYMHHSV